MKNQLNKKNYIAIADWMLELGLNVRELLTYATIYGFTQDGSYYYASLEYLASWLGINDRTNATRYLTPLVKKGLITKKDITFKNNQKGCAYKTTDNKGNVINNPDVDYIVIQPWMLQDMHLNGKDLLLYALVHSYSRKDSNNVCKFYKDYFAKWLQCRKDNVGRQIEQAVKKGLIESKEDGYVAIVPDDIKPVQNNKSSEIEEEIDFTQIDNTLPQTDNTPGFEEFNFTQTDITFPHFDNTPSLKLTTNNILLDNIKDNISLFNNNNSSNFINDVNYDNAVVVNHKLLSFNELTKEEELVLQTKINYDANILKKHHCEEWVIKFMSAIAETKFRRYSITCDIDNAINKNNIENKTEETLLKLLRKYKSYVTKSDLDKLSDIYHEALDIYDEEYPKRNAIRSKEAYLVGVIKNVFEII